MTDVPLEKIYEAQRRIRGYAFRTPAYECFSQNGLYLKLECFQPVRSFKIRGATNKILSIPEEDRRKRGVITASSGNHGLAVAYVANRLGISATIVLPENVVPDKNEMILGLGARAVLAGNQADERAKRAEEIASKEGQIYVHPYNDEEIVAGQGTCGLEILEDLPDVEQVFVPIGGGGLISGVASAIKQMGNRTKDVRVVGVQPEGSPSMYKSLRNGELSSIEYSRSIADGLLVRRPGDITFALVKRFVDDIVLVSDQEILNATFQLLKKEHVLAEPSGAASFAAAMRSVKEQEQKSIGGRVGKSLAIISGGNISQETLLKVITANYKS